MRSIQLYLRGNYHLFEKYQMTSINPTELIKHEDKEYSFKQLVNLYLNNHQKVK
jgi:hypothetical protein